MKKLLTLVAAVALAAAAQASCCSWKLTTGSTYAGMNVYALTGTSASAVLALCQSSDSADWEKAVDGFSSVKATSGSRGTASGTVDGVVAGDKITFLITDGDITEGSKYWIVNDVVVANLFDPPSTGTAKSYSPDSLAGSGTFEAIPEPTSGLLMLLGMAGLALRRRRA